MAHKFCHPLLDISQCYISSFFTRILRRPNNTDVDYFDDKDINLYMDTRSVGGVSGPQADTKIPSQVTRFMLRFRFLKYKRQLPTSFLNHGRKFWLQGTVVSNEDDSTFNL